MVQYLLDQLNFVILIGGAVLAGLEAAIIIWYGWTMPKIAKVLYAASRKSTGTLVLGADDQGIMEAHLTTSKLAMGILKVVGKKRIYWFGPRPTFNIPEVTVPKMTLDPILDAEGKQMMNEKGEPLYQRATAGEMESVPLLAPVDKRMIDELNLNIHKVAGINIPVMIGYTSKLTAVTPRALEYLTRVHKITDWKGKGELMEGDLKLMHPRILKEYFRWNLNPSIIESLTLEHEKIGEERAGGMGGFSWGIVLSAMGFLMSLVLFVMLYQSGVITF